MVEFSKPILIGSAIGSVVGFYFLIKNYFAPKMYEVPNLIENKVVIVTGANSGIGKETVRELAKRKGKIIIAGRNLKLCEEARNEIVSETNNKNVYCMECDLSSQESIKKFVESFKKEYNELHILINNAGVMRCPRMLTKDGIEMQLGVNHIGHFLLTMMLLDLLKKSAPSRIINLSSIAHFRGRINKEDLNSEKSYDEGSAYGQSKLANVLFTNELSRKLKGTGVTVNSVHPGIVDTGIFRHDSNISNLFLNPISRIFVKNPVEGAQTTLYAALSPDLEGISGKYFADCQEAKQSREAQDESLAKWLWNESMKLTKLDQIKEYQI